MQFQTVHWCSPYGVVRGLGNVTIRYTAHTTSYTSLTETILVSCTFSTCSELFVTNFFLPHVYLVAPMWVTLFTFRQDFLHQKAVESLSYCVLLFLSSYL